MESRSSRATKRQIVFRSTRFATATGPFSTACTSPSTRPPRYSDRRNVHRVTSGHANITTTARYLNVKDDYLQELIERKPLALIRA